MVEICFFFWFLEGEEREREVEFGEERYGDGSLIMGGVHLVIGGFGVHSFPIQHRQPYLIIHETKLFFGVFKNIVVEMKL